MKPESRHNPEKEKAHPGMILELNILQSPGDNALFGKISGAYQGCLILRK